MYLLNVLESAKQRERLLVKHKDFLEQQYSHAPVVKIEAFFSKTLAITRTDMASGTSFTFLKNSRKKGKNSIVKR